MANSKMPTTTEIYADFIFPWCYIGLDRLTRLATDGSVRLHWNPCLLRPDTPAGQGTNRKGMQP